MAMMVMNNKNTHQGMSNRAGNNGLFNEKIASVRRSTCSCPVKSSLETATVTSEEFQECTEEDVGRIIMNSLSKSCALDPLPTNILKEFLPVILPFITDMCNTSLQQGMLPLSQRNAIITSCLKKANTDPTDARNYRLISNLTFT